MPVLPAESEEMTGELPMIPESVSTRLTGARHSGCVTVAVREAVAEGVPDAV